MPRPLPLILVLSAAGCASAPISSAADVILGEAVVTLDEEAAPPTRAGEARCEVKTWASARTVLLRCAPVPPGPEGTLALSEALGAQPGVLAAHPNRIRKGMK